MPNFDGTGPLKRGQGNCRKGTEGCRHRNSDPESPDKKEADEE